MLLFLRFLFHEINLRHKHDSSSCMDTFNITDHFSPHDSQLRGSFCGTQTDLVITCRSNDVTVRLDIGELTSDMPKKLGFIASYNASSKLNNNSAEQSTNTVCAFINKG